MTCYETKNENFHKPLKKFFLGLSVIGVGGYVCLDFKDFKNSNPSCGAKDYTDLKFKQIRETGTIVCNFAHHFISKME